MEVGGNCQTNQAVHASRTFPPAKIFHS